MQEIITIKQLPVLEEKFAEIGKNIDEKLERCQKMTVSEENVKDVKKNPCRTQQGTLRFC